MKKFVKAAACTAIAAMMAVPAFAHGAGHMNHHWERGMKQGWGITEGIDMTVKNDAADMKKLEMPELTEEQRAQLAARRDECVNKLDELVQAYRSAQTEEEKEAAFRNICGACHKGMGWGSIRPGQLQRPEMTEEQKAVFEEMRAKCSELREKIKAAQTDEEREALKNELKALMKEYAPARNAKEAAPQTNEEAASFGIAQVEPLPEFEMDFEFIPVPDEN